MANKTWTFQLEDGRHAVELEHGYWSGRRIIRVDGEQIEVSRKFLDAGTEHRFEISGHPGILRIRSGALGGLLGFDYELVVDGRLV